MGLIWVGDRSCGTEPLGGETCRAGSGKSGLGIKELTGRSVGGDAVLDDPLAPRRVPSVASNASENAGTPRLANAEARRPVCKICQNDNDRNSAFCTLCGAHLWPAEPMCKCGAALVLETQFCPTCGDAVPGPWS
jgi:hypothetical protein